MTAIRTLEELINLDEPAWPLVQEWISCATNKVEVLPRDELDARDCLVSMQVTTRSPMGAIIYHTGGLLIDDGWVRLLGAGCSRLPRGMHTWNWNRAVIPDGRRPEVVLIADDVIGGFFALDGGRLGDGKGNVFYFAPDTLEWEDMERGYTDFLQWCLEGDLEGYYQDSRWQGWRDDVSKLTGDRVMHIAPWLFNEGPPVDQRSRRPVPIQEVWDMFVGNDLLAEDSR